MSFLKSKKPFYRLRPESRLSLASSAPSHLRSSSDGEPEKSKAVALLRKYRSDQGKSEKRNDNFKNDDVNAVLLECLETPQTMSPGLICALLGYGHDINYSVREKMFGRYESQRNDIVQRATESRDFPFVSWKLLIEKADQIALNEAFGFAVQNNMVAKAEICLQIAASPNRGLWLNASEALMTTVDLAAQNNSESLYLRLVLVLLKRGNGGVNSTIPRAKKKAEEAGHTMISQVLLEHSLSIQSISQIPSLQSFGELQAIQNFSGLPQGLRDSILLEETSKGVVEACDKFLALLKNSQSRIEKSSCGTALADLLQRCSSSADWIPPKTLEVVGGLLPISSYCPEVDAAFCRTLRNTDLTRYGDYRDAAELLAHSTLGTTFNIVLDSIPLGSNFCDDDLWRLHCLLEWGASGESVHLALCLALYARIEGVGPKPDGFIQTLVNAELDVNCEEGEILRTAADCGNIEILGQLLARASPGTKLFAFAVAILARNDESVLLASIDQFKPSKTEPLVGEEVPDGYFPHLFVCLQLYPKSRKLVDSLLKAGCSVDAEIEYYPSEEYSDDIDSVTPLIFALCQSGHIEADKQIGSDVIDLLIEKGDINFQTRKSMITPLILAAKYQRKKIVAKLLEKQAKTSSKDFLERSALFYASRNGDLSSVKALLQAGAPVDDGSLNEAARELHDDVVKALIKKGHTVNSRSTNKEHDHRTALEEMLLKCDGNAGLSKIEDTLRTLTKGKLTDEDFFMALNNPASITLVKALLKVGMKQPLMEGDLLLAVSVDKFIYSYSPTMYIRHGLSSSPVEMQDGLLAEIIGNKGVDRFNAQETSVQPAGYTGAHPRIRLAEEQRSYDREADINSLPPGSRQKRRK
ncbi:hypothetical protein F5882DRAFT_491051 [Hyaloscypha sp. PMI_1271]|nr:hypothetical protein F5882DRAFT_491051 [Hyaloscypha sp. PMI_1271]